ncbi:hypothetical protein WJX73_000673 [Symbiochloris irregularis]|uniref:EGF-like domain-containing protein n=1 Tax=Symbiochloris irregularis TaxID=706552 RepID=A0AAW1P725_9CHLO
MNLWLICLFNVVVGLLLAMPERVLGLEHAESHGASEFSGGLPDMCAGTLGTWCQDYQAQKPFMSKAWSSSDWRCSDENCNNVGNCNRDIGICDCMAGWTGDDCKTRQLRPCTNKHRKSGFQPQGPPQNSSEPGWTASRCAGVCDDDRAICYCNGTLGRIPPAPGSPPGTPPLQLGRPMVLEECNPNKDDFGNPVAHGQRDPELLFGANGWCEAKQPQWQCPCVIEGRTGPTCDDPAEHTCNNQCSGHGRCNFGFCMCDEGFYGHDCARHVAGADLKLDLSQRPWLRDVTSDAAVEASRAQTRLRPLIYIYDLPSIYNTRMVEYRVNKGICFWRSFVEGNGTSITQWTYSIAPLLHEHLLQSPHRTLDPEQADFFYVPVYTSCFMHPIFMWADAPFWYGPDGPRVMHTARMLLEAKQWLQTHLPYWNRKGGKDHVWLVTHDEGSCWVPSEIRPSIILSHWGRRDVKHVSNTAFPADNYSSEYVHPEWSPNGWTNIIKGHACYDPDKDLIIPSFLGPSYIKQSPLLGFPARERKHLLFFRGNMGRGRAPHYSRGIRQRLHHLSQHHRWRDHHSIVIGPPEEAGQDGEYAVMLSSSRFCLVVPGDGFSPRAEDAILHGCVPVVIMDNVDPVFATALDWRNFSVRIAEDDLEHLPKILKAISQQQLETLQHGLSHSQQQSVLV